ncbi:MAG: PD-(D/E)XK nuclease-like domain-containing protein [Flavobacteriaceae bacterium]|jgi:hypothetical protein|nr:PD-(D/E)XK nuclease-like domain-containing protein [Flavobacteriaceae bacterium]
MDAYYQRNEVSNSDLSWLKKQMYGDDTPDPTEAYKFGTLVDALLTEFHKVDLFKKQVDGVQYKDEDWEAGLAMKKAFEKDAFCQNLLAQSSTQEVMSKMREFEFDTLKFSLNVRCKWDLFMDRLGWGGDIKSTAAATQKQFEDAVKYFDYDRQRAWYMDIAGSNQDILIGISKKNFKIFKVPIKRGGELYNSGKEKYSFLAFQWWTLFR